MCCAPKEPVRALGGAGACLAARFHPAWLNLTWAFQAHRVHSQAALRPLHPPAPVTGGFPCRVGYSSPVWDGDSPNSLPHRQEEELCVVAFLRAERSGDPGAQPTFAPSLLCTKGDRSSCLSGRSFLPRKKEGTPHGAP